MFKLAVLLGLVTLSFRTFYSCGSGSGDPIECLRITNNIPVVTREGELIENNDYFNIYYSKDLIMYEFRYKFDSVVDKKVVAMEHRKEYFIHKKGASTGYFYGRDNMDSGISISVDSILNAQALQNFQWHLLPAARKPVDSSIAEGGVFTELYVGPNQYNRNFNDSVFFSYDNTFKKYPYSFSRILDSVKGRKLVRVKLISPSVYSDQYNITFPRKESLFEMRAVRVDDIEKIKQYFERFKKNTVI